MCLTGSWRKLIPIDPVKHMKNIVVMDIQSNVLLAKATRYKNTDLKFMKIKMVGPAETLCTL